MAFLARCRWEKETCVLQTQNFHFLSSVKHFANSLVWTPSVRESFSFPKVLFINVRGGGGAFLGRIHGWKLACRRLACQCRHHATFMVNFEPRSNQKVLAHTKVAVSSASRHRHFSRVKKKCGLRPVEHQKWSAGKSRSCERKIELESPTAAALH